MPHDLTQALRVSGFENYGDEERVSTQGLYLHPARFLKYCNWLAHPPLLVFALPVWRPQTSRCWFT